ncbi:NAD-dependent epimerase/dehydratase family protein [Phyllobacterium salinisoli]|uniref:NAD-dependent epimerase/dehydratase family protein n=1 Tax=Phyllobacterium salinisoli TaxID=1899321 RepID=A0A368K8Q1_9HYPH|nr:NAD-dependent epimerase/dehydratase family protein [Phyllobacterium salinisoli]RCS25736.1 NAD-dependent epimerase/dehydratase family protein [Phyllobacterium salinisoli]
MSTGPVRILVTGASGFIGRALVPHLLKAGYAVRATSRAPDRLNSEGVETVMLPPPDAPPADFEALIAGCDHVVHLAAIAHAAREQAAAAYEAANKVLAERLAEAAHRAAPGKFVFISSIRAQCGPVRDGIVRETDPATPEDDYGRAKLAAERTIASIFAGSGKFTILRPVLVYGPGVRGNMGMLIRLARTPLPLPFARLDARRSLLDREALCDAILHAMREPRTDGGTYLVADAAPLSVAEIVVAVRMGLGRRAALFPLPQSWLEGLAGLAGQSKRWQAVTGGLVASPLLLEATGWSPPTDTFRRIAGSVRQERGK